MGTLPRKSCFGIKLLPTYNEDILAFKDAYLALGISITVKAHIIFDHLAYVLDGEENGHGLGFYSEQARLVSFSGEQSKHLCSVN